ncbi:MAG TPA: hypothetical protein VNX68_15015, partial [Nitrosopumilaceae archaeon]|nr:hypothetical protein [Nitrosopumilaceae archaeon]
QKIKDPTGTLRRVGDSIIKVSMLLSLSHSLEMKISERDMEEAIEKCEILVGNVRKTTMNKGGKHPLAEQKALVIQELIERSNHTISRQMLLDKYWMHFNVTELDEIVQSLEGAGIVQTEAIGGQILYVMPEVKYLEFLERMKGRK